MTAGRETARMNDLTRHVGCGSVDDMTGCAKCDAIRAALAELDALRAQARDAVSQAYIAQEMLTEQRTVIASVEKKSAILVTELSILRAVIEAQRKLVESWREYMATSRAEASKAMARGDLQDSNARKTEVSVLAVCIADLAATLPPQEPV